MSLEEKAAHALLLEATRSGRGTGSDDEELDAIPLSEEEVYKRDVDALPDAPDMDGTFCFRFLFFFYIIFFVTFKSRLFVLFCIYKNMMVILILTFSQRTNLFPSKNLVRRCSKAWDGAKAHPLVSPTRRMLS